MKLRWSWLSWPLLTSVVACTSIIGFNDLHKVEDDATKDAGTKTTGTTPPDTTPTPTPTTPPPPATVCKTPTPWGTPIALPSTVNGSDDNRNPTLSSDELTIYYERSTTGSTLRGNVMTATRASVTSAFGAATPVAELGSNNQYSPSLSKDGLTLLFAQLVGSGSGTFDVFAATRATATGAFSNVHALSQVNQNNTDDLLPFFASTGELFFASMRSASQLQIWRSVFTGGDFGAPALIGELAGNVSGDVLTTSLSPDGLSLYFGTLKTTSDLKDDIWIASRAAQAGVFASPSLVTELSTAANDEPGWISPDNCRMYMSSDRNGSYQLFVASRSP